MYTLIMHYMCFQCGYRYVICFGEILWYRHPAMAVLVNYMYYLLMIYSAKGHISWVHESVSVFVVVHSVMSTDGFLVLLLWLEVVVTDQVFIWFCISSEAVSILRFTLCISFSFSEVVSDCATGLPDHHHNGCFK